MKIIQNGYSCKEKIMLFYKLFFDVDEDITVYSNFSYDEKTINAYTMIEYDGDIYCEDYYFDFSSDDKRLRKKVFEASITKSFCHAAKKIKNINLPWGVMCGIRPAKMVRELYDKGYSKAEAIRELKNIYETSEEKLILASTVAENEKMILDSIGKNSVSIYIGIPFCPTRCLYCSFVSTDVRVSGKYMDEYVNLLVKEIEKTAEIINKLGFYTENIYIGGGTPTTLSAENLDKIFKALKKYIITDKLKEFTLEAGRPDTITKEKLIVSKNAGVNRISINPQTMNEQTLKKIGRAHTSQMIRECFLLARECGFFNINMDLIAGLPDETPEMFYKSLDEVIKLDPENITVHCMCIKRAASLRFSDVELANAKNMNDMLSYTQKRMAKTAREPYYMYRQKNISGNLENVGYAKKGYMSKYNVNIMEELQTIIALGGGGSTKIVIGDKIERIFNFKDPVEYIKRFDEILKKKDDILNYYK